MITELLGIARALAGFNHSPAVVAEVACAGRLGVVAATALTPDGEQTWIGAHAEEEPHGVDQPLPENEDPYA